ncbi:MAG: peptidase [Gammaproteobacteria bacterium]|nr:peptidase [Gammaproteobacteria bacterium]
MLAGIPQAPTAGNPINGPERALRRRNLVLQRMFEQGSISEADYLAAVAAPVSARVHERTLDVSAPHVAEWVRQILVNRLGTEVYTAGYEATTTLRPDLQTAANLALREGLLRYDRRHGYRGPVDHVDLDADMLADRVGLASAMTRYPLSPGMEPALVMALSDTGFTALLGANVEVEVPLELLRWARPYIDVNTRGATPTKPADVVAVGDIVNLRQIPEGWALAQAPDIQGALVSLDPATGGVLAMVGGYDFPNNQYNHAMQGGRQPGSGFKPFVYSAAIASGVTPASIFMDAPLVFEDENLETTYRPKNDGERYNGPTRLREALYRSINLVSMRVLLSVGASRVLDHVAGFGFDTTSFPRNTQLAIGGGTMAITPLQMVNAYAAFANGGFLVTPHVLTQVTTLDGTLVFEDTYPRACDPCEPLIATHSPESPLNPESVPEAALPSPLASAPRAIDERNAFIIDSMLRDVIRRGTGRRARVLERDDIAGKTGTTNEADNWFNGYQQSVATTVWVGFSDHRPLGDNEYGSNSPLPIWIDYMRVALAGVPEAIRQQPAGVVTMKVDPRSGEPVAPDQPNAIAEYFLTEFAPEYRPKGQTPTVDGGAPLRPTDIF